jgi:hypothetical protein
MLTSFEGPSFLTNMGDRAMNRFEELMFKAEQAELTARKAESNWAWQYWQGVADKLKEEALALPLEEIC